MMADELAKLYPEDTILNGNWLPSIRASIEISRNNPSKAIEILQSASRYDFGVPTPEPMVASPLYPVYIRGQAYLALHKGTEAAAEFQRIVDRPYLVANYVTGSLAHLGLARARVLEAESAQGPEADAARAKAKNAYQDFFALWKDADADIPILIAAKAEYAKLQ